MYPFIPWTETSTHIVDIDDYNNVQNTVLGLAVIESSVH